MKIALIIGHSLVKQGASEDGLTEFDYNDQLLTSMGSKLPGNHQFAAFYRSSDIKTYSEQMDAWHERLANWGCELAIEFHLNDFWNEDVDGHEVLAMSDNSMKYATLLNTSFSKYLTNNDRGPKKITSADNGYGFLSRGNYPCIIAEPFFITQINSYIHGTAKRSTLIKAYIEFFKDL